MVEREIIYLLLHCQHQNDSCIKMGSDESHFNVSFIVRDKFTRQCSQTTIFDDKGEPKQNRTEVPRLTSLTPYCWAKLAHSVFNPPRSPPHTPYTPSPHVTFAPSHFTPSPLSKPQKPKSKSKRRRTGDKSCLSGLCAFDTLASLRLKKHLANYQFLCNCVD